MIGTAQGAAMQLRPRGGGKACSMSPETSISRPRAFSTTARSITTRGLPRMVGVVTSVVVVVVVELVFRIGRRRTR